MVKSAYCPTCERDVSFSVKEVECTTSLDGVEYAYWVKQAVCEKCGGEAVYEPFEEEAGRAFNEAVREKKGLVSLAKIREMPKRYNIGKRPLSLLLGWGEITYTRFMDGQAPSQEYSDVIERLYSDPAAYYRVLVKGKDRISKIAFRKSEEAVASVLDSDFKSSEKIYEVADYFCILSEGDITTMMLQKLTYYAQGFSYVFLDSPLFEQCPMVGDAGPVYGQLLQEYQGKDLLVEYSNQGQAEAKLADAFEGVEEELLKAVFNSFGRYSGSILTQMVLNEDPIASRNGTSVKTQEKPEHDTVPTNDMKNYFRRIANAFGMKSSKDIAKYADEAFSKSTLAPTG
ncbi:type II toxin-antitoxin system antitoxin SocA domain-containing protein [Raoultibacter phocaeensis]|uniref:type II toxin-antitoxin system antitoxin SocA domain-containing protein n=1 Tax=Raoultibacter phocaeensis TaxID=2479841 RepID=UPI0011191DE3|nr:type II toxin-antitoxin system antitoxin SocA domain-containing protein [Raoultibacter phocaeensis]